jgi:nitric-oxide synthase
MLHSLRFPVSSRRAVLSSRRSTLNCCSAAKRRVDAAPILTLEEILDADEFRLPDEVDAEDAAAAAEPPPAAAPVSTPAPPPLELQFVQGACYGCGARLQVTTELAPGYVSPERYAPKALHRQHDQLLCARCNGLANGKLVNAVQGQGSRFPDMVSLVTPDELRAHLGQLRDRHALVVLLVDAVDFSGSFLPRLRDAVGRNPVLLVVTKADLLPSGTDERALEKWLEAEVAHRRLALAGLHLVSALGGDGMREAVGAMCALRRGRDVVVAGAANVGKSSFIRAALAALRARGDFSAPERRLPLASLLPGTTLGVIPLRAFDGKATLYDTPGVVLHHRVNGMLDEEELRALAPGRHRLGRLRALPAEAGAAERGEGGESAAEAVGRSFFLEGLLRVDCLRAPPGTRLIFWGPTAGARLRSLPLQQALDGATPWAEADVPIGAAAAQARGGLQPVRDVELSAGTRAAPLADVQLSGLGGWFTVIAGGSLRRGAAAGPQSLLLRVWAPRGAEVFVRPPMPVQPTGFW